MRSGPGAITQPEQLRELTVIIHRDMPDTFEEWRKAMNIADLEPAAIDHYDSGQLMLDAAAQGLGVATGLAPNKAHTLLRLLAPVAMAYLAKRMFDSRQAKATGATPASAAVPAPPSADELGHVLHKEEAQITQQGGVGGQLLGAVLDRNHDGKVDFSDLLSGLNGSRA